MIFFADAYKPSLNRRKILLSMEKDVIMNVQTNLLQSRLA